MPKYRVTADALRIRSGPGITYAITGMLLRDDVVEGGELANDWLKVITEDNKSGWSHRGYLELIDETPLPPAQVVYRVDANALNVRQGPGLRYAVIASLKSGELVG